MAFAVVTGASTGIGKELVLLCARAGHDLVLTARNRDQLEALGSEISTKFKRQVLIVPKDLSVPGAAGELFEELRNIHNSVEILINNAGFGLRGLFAELDADAQMQMLQLNCGALTQLSRLFVPAMIARGRGYILNVASTAAFQPGPLMAVYYATKAYVVSFSSALHEEVKNSGVAVTTLCPGPTVTEFQKRAGLETTRLFKSSHVMTAKDVAEIGFAALMKKKPLVIAGGMNAAMAFLTRFAPRQFTAAMARKFQEV